MRTLIAVVAMILPGAALGDTSAAVARAKAGAFDETGEIACAQEVGQTLGTCPADVAREGGSAAVVVTFRNGFKRTLTFDDRAFLRGNATMSGVGTDTDWQLDGETYLIRVDDQRFEIPKTLVFGD